MMALFHRRIKGMNLGWIYHREIILILYQPNIFKANTFQANKMKLFVSSIFLSGQLANAQYTNTQVSNSEAKFATSVFNTMTICNDWIERALGKFLKKSSRRPKTVSR